MDSEPYILFGDAMERIRKAGLDFGQDRWEAWLRSGLVEATVRIAGTNEYGMPRARWTRLIDLLIIDHQLFGRRSPEAVAYFAATWGIDVPADLVADHLVKSIETFYRILRRRVLHKTAGLGGARELTEDDARHLARISAKDLQRIVPIKNPIKRALAKQFAEEFCFVGFRMIYHIKPSASFGDAIRKVANAIFQAPVAALGAQFLRKGLEREGQRFIDPQTGDNQMLREIRDTQRSRPQLILRACRDSGLMFGAARRAFGLDAQRGQGAAANDLTGTARENARLFYALLPLVSAYLLAFNLDSPNSQFLSMLRKSEGAGLEQQIKRLDRLTEWQRRRLEKGL